MSSSHIFGFINSWLRKSSKFNQLKNSPDRETSKSFAVKAIIASVFAVVFAALFALAFKSWRGTSGLETLSLTWLYVIGFIICAFSFLALELESLLDVQYQLRLNKRALSWISLVIFLLSLIGGVSVFFILFNKTIFSLELR